MVNSEMDSDFKNTRSPAATALRPEPLVVAPLASDQIDQWDAFVLNHADGSPFHLNAWRGVIEDAFGYRAHYLMAMMGERVCGVLPLFFVENLLLKKALISSPFAVYGGILAVSSEVAAALYGHAKDLGYSLGVQYIDYRNKVEDQCVEVPNVSRYVTFTQSIDADEETLLKSIPRKTRYMVRKAMTHPYLAIQTRLTHRFFDLYSRNLRRLGTPCFPLRFFDSILEHFGDSVEIREFWIGDQLAASVLSFLFRDQLLPYYGCSEPKLNHFAPNNYMYFDLMRWGARNGYRHFDFGRSKKNTGAYDFKAHWGMRERVLPYGITPINCKAIPNHSPTNPHYSIPIRMWKYVPVQLTRALGPYLVRLVP